MIAFEQRACTVLFNLLRSYPEKGTFLLPANVCPIVPLVFFKAQRPFEFVDISLDTLCIDEQTVIERWAQPGNKPAGLLYVRTYGNILHQPDIFANVKSLSPDALIIDDRCLCPPVFGEVLDPNIDAALYSTGYAKFVDIGFGGYGVIKDGIPYQRLVSDFDPQTLGRVSDQYKIALATQTCFSYIDGDWLDMSPPEESWTTYQENVTQESARVAQVKRAINAIYSSQLPSQIQFPGVFQNWRFNIQVREKTAALEAIRRAGLFASGHYESLAGLFGPGNAPFARKLHRNVINLFNDRYFSPEKAIQLTGLLADFAQLPPDPLFK